MTSLSRTTSKASSPEAPPESKRACLHGSRRGCGTCSTPLSEAEEELDLATRPLPPVAVPLSFLPRGLPPLPSAVAAAAAPLSLPPDALTLGGVCEELTNAHRVSATASVISRSRSLSALTTVCRLAASRSRPSCERCSNAECVTSGKPCSLISLQSGEMINCSELVTGSLCGSCKVACSLLRYCSCASPSMPCSLRNCCCFCCCCSCC